MDSKNKSNLGKIESFEVSKNKFDVLKSDFFLQKAMNLIKIKKRLDIARYNKNIQKRLNINLNTYKQYSEKYSSIEIELELSPFPKEEKIVYINRELNSFYHIYFNGDKIKDFNYMKSHRNLITKINIIIDYQVDNFDGLFKYCEYISSINFKRY